MLSGERDLVRSLAVTPAGGAACLLRIEAAAEFAGHCLPAVGAMHVHQAAGGRKEAVRL